MYGVAKQLIKDKYKAMLIFLGTSLAFTEMYMLLFPTIKASSDQFTQLMKMYPESLFKAFGLDAATLTFARIEYFLSSEIFSLIWPILLIILAIQIANYSFAGEIEEATIELSLSQPIARVKLFFARYLAGLFLISVFVFTSIGLMVPMIILHGFEYSGHAFWLMAIVGFLFALAVYSIAVLFSVIFSSKGRASSVTAGILILMYVMNVISALKASLENLQYGSFFHYFVAGVVLAKDQMVDYTYPVFLGVSMVAVVAAAFWFVRRDLSV
jgi:ABC-2 type transport system permease protein